MPKNSTSGANPEFELVAPVKILVKPGFSGAGTETRASSLRRRSIPQYEVSSGSHSDQPGGGHGGESGNVYLISDHVKELRREASVEIEENDVVKNAAYYMDHCLRLMYLTGMSTYNTDKNDKTLIEIILKCVQKVKLFHIDCVGFNWHKFCLFIFCYFNLNYLYCIDCILDGDIGLHRICCHLAETEMYCVCH